MRKLFLFGSLCLLGKVTTAQNKQITLEDIWKNGTFRMKSVPGFNAMKDGKTYLQTDNEGGKSVINVYDLATGKKLKTLFDNEVFGAGGKPLAFADYSLSTDERRLLLYCEGENIYRRSVLWKVYAYDLTAKKLTQIDTGKILHASFSPDGTKVAFVKENNLFYKDLANGGTTQVTNDGQRNKIINGNCDWVYEEEFEFTQAYQWSPEGKHLAYYKFDESAVPEYTMTVYDALYPTPYKYKYPKAGERNSTVGIYVYDLAAKTNIHLDLHEEQDQYIPRIKWSQTDSMLGVFRMNRHQNELELLFAHLPDGKLSSVYQERNQYYIDVTDNFAFLPDNRSFLISSEKSGNNQLYRYDWKAKLMQPISAAGSDIESITGIDEQKKLVYYSAAVNSPMERQQYVADWNGKSRKCITPEPGTHGVAFCQGNRYFLDKYSGLNQVPVFYLRDARGKIVRSLEDNAALRKKMDEYQLGNIRFTRIMGVKEELNAWMITPPGFDSTKKYPVLMYQYSGPGSQMVGDKFPVGDFFWHQMLAQKGYIIFCADGTGTGFRGESFKKQTYKQLGKLESEDQIAVARNLAKLPFVDGARIGIWGWSFGGFMSSTCILKGNDVFKMAIAVAPVTNWRYYDNIYTERYMQTPVENPEGYDENAPEKMASRLKGKFLLVHGTADDNVHFQNSVMLAEQLIQNNKAFEDAYYPNKNHGISGGNTRLHLYDRMTRFILQNL
ncbi:S9 family peptidase [Rurimicrobium arvi]|uniref:S9 family peptidase n=1 Tax=Rurimicrobium arvi TaxID=2049916 RepID=A0ABP8MWP2_9BACT